MKIVRKPRKDLWVVGKIGKCGFNAKVYDIGSKFGINGGRVSKLAIWDDKVRQPGRAFFSTCFVNYDRGWDIEPETQEEKETYTKLLDYLEKLPPI